MGRRYHGEWEKEDSEEWYREQYDEEPYRDEVQLTEHQARNDYQDAKEPFGTLSNRDRDEKEDVTIEDSRHHGSKQPN